MTPRRILVVGWLGLVLYAYPGFLSSDSVAQLLQARSGVRTGGHPPVMSVLWAALDSIVAGPLLMLVAQTACFIVGAYLLLRQRIAPRPAALLTVAVAWFPPISTVLAVIWKDAQMAAYLVLGAALLLENRRGRRIGGLALIWLATAMRYNALAITFPIVVLLFAWSPVHRWYQRYALALAVWVGITVASFVVNRALTTSAPPNLWANTVALFDLTGTLRHASDLDPTTLDDSLAGVPLRSSTPQASARADHPRSLLSPSEALSIGGGEYIPSIWVASSQTFQTPATEAERAAVARAFRSLVIADPGAYLTHRWHVLRERIQLGTPEIEPAAYIWFIDALDWYSGHRIEHDARPSKLQRGLRPAMSWLGTTWMFRPWIYLVLAVVLLVLSVWARDRASIALLLGGLANEAALFLIAPTIDYRYSFWLVVASVVVLATRVAMVTLHRRERRASVAADPG